MVGAAVNRAFLPAKSLFEQVGELMILTARTIASAVRPPYPYGEEFIGQFLFALRLCWFPLLVSTVAICLGAPGLQGANALTAITGAPPTFFNVSSDTMKADDVFAKVKAATEKGGCVVADSKSFGSPVKGMISDHTYSVLGTSEEDGQKYVTVRNPWGEHEVGNDGKDDGVFKLTAQQFLEAFEMVEYVHPS